MSRRTIAALAALGAGPYLIVGVATPSAADPAGEGWNSPASPTSTDTQGFHQLS